MARYIINNLYSLDDTAIAGLCEFALRAKLDKDLARKVIGQTEKADSAN